MQEKRVLPPAISAAHGGSPLSAGMVIRSEAEKAVVSEGDGDSAEMPESREVVRRRASRAAGREP